MTSSVPPSSNGLDDTTPDPRKDSLIEYPCLFPVKVMGLKTDDFYLQMAALAQRHDPFLDPASIAQRDSSGGKYISLTITITATSREHLDNIYRGLSGHPLVKYVI
jgi:putative lipoic acid-binding regulatory protein